MADEIQAVKNSTFSRLCRLPKSLIFAAELEGHEYEADDKIDGES